MDGQKERLMGDDGATQLAVADGKPLANSGEAVLEIKVYPARWWILFAFSMYAFVQGMLWAIPGPISGAYGDLYKIDATTIQLLINYGPIFYLPLSLPFALWMDMPGGVRWSTLFGVTITFIGQVLRTIARDASTSSIVMIHISYILNAIAGPVAMGAVGKISEDWFPPNFRATSTAIMSEANLFGGAAAQVLGPMMVETDDWKHLENFMYVCLALAIIMQVSVMAYFPSHPPTPPSASAETTKNNEQAMGLRTFGAALKSLMLSKNFMVLICAYGFSTGMYGSWATVLSLNLADCDPAWVGWLSFTSTIAGNVGGILLGRYVDRFRHLKTLLVTLMGLAAACFTAFAVLVSGAIPAVSQTICHADGSPGPGLWPLFVVGALGGLFLNSTIPLYFELSMEVTYPIPEGTVCTMLTNMNNVGCLIFLGIPVGQYGTAWMNWLFSMTILAFFFALIFFFEKKELRYAVDTAGQAGHKGIGGADAKYSKLVDHADAAVAAVINVQGLKSIN